MTKRKGDTANDAVNYETNAQDAAPPAPPPVDASPADPMPTNAAAVTVPVDAPPPASGFDVPAPGAIETPSAGGSYIRQPDGSLVKREG